MGKRLCTLGLVFIVTLGSPGCVLSLFLASLDIRPGDFPESFEQVINIAGLSIVASCDVETFLDEPDHARFFDCDYSLPGQPPMSSGLGLYGSDGFNLFTLILDPLIVELPDDIPDISGTFDDGAGHSGELIVYPALPYVPVDDTRTLTARPGKQLVVLDLPEGVPTEQVNYQFRLRLQQQIFRPTGVVPEVRGMLTGKVTVNGKTFYQPLLPCTGDFGAVPMLGIPNSRTAAPVTLPPAAGTGCANMRYDYATPTDICDLDNDRDIDNTDLQVIAARRGRRAAAGDPRDVNDDLASTRTTSRSAVRAAPDSARRLRACTTSPKDRPDRSSIRTC